MPTVRETAGYETPEGRTRFVTLWVSVSLFVTALSAGLIALVAMSRNQDEGRAPPGSSKSAVAKVPTPIRIIVPSSAPTQGYPRKQVQITHICNVPDFDGHDEPDTQYVAFQTQTVNEDHVEITVALNGEAYWPTSDDRECDDDGYSIFCRIPASMLTSGCYLLRRSKVKEYTEPYGNLTVTIRDEDYFYDDAFEVFVDAQKWADPAHCGVEEINVTTTDPRGKGASIRMNITSLCLDPI